MNLVPTTCCALSALCMLPPLVAQEPLTPSVQITEAVYVDDDGTTFGLADGAIPEHTSSGNITLQLELTFPGIPELPPEQEGEVSVVTGAFAWAYFDQLDELINLRMSVLLLDLAGSGDTDSCDSLGICQGPRFECSDELGNGAVASDPAELGFGPHQPGADPAHDHRRSVPALHAAGVGRDDVEG